MEQTKNNWLVRRQRIEQFFWEKFQTQPTAWLSSSGRAEIVGNHTDHNLGRVLVSAISCDILCACAPRTDGVVEIVAEDFNPICFSVYDLSMREREKNKSISLARGVLSYLTDKGYKIGGFSAVTHSNIFRGAGVSSSAAFEVLVAEIANVLYLNGVLTPNEKALAGHYAENTYFGKPCGLLDQTGIAYGGLNRVDFFTGEVEKIPPLQGYSLVLTNTGGSHAKLTAHYADIKREMGEVSAFFGKRYLREVPFEQVKEGIFALRKRVSDRAILRAIHYYEENERVDLACSALKSGNKSVFFEQITKSGQSSLCYLQNCYPAGEVAQPMTLAIKLSEQILTDGAARIQGGGFAGTILAFCSEAEKERYGREMAKVFGKENVYFTQMREKGACQV